jgi:type VI secretion system secreted protein Hcp
MAVDAFIWFLKFDTIEGESTEKGHEKELEVMSFHWGVSQTGSFASGGGGGAGKAQFQDLHFTSNTSKASPQLMLACASGRHLKYATLTGRKSGGDRPADFMHVKIEDVLVSSYNQAGDRNSGPGDEASLNFAKIEFSFTPQNADGSLGTPVTTGWDLKANKAV